MTKLVEKDNGVQVNSENIGVLVHPGEIPGEHYTSDIIVDYNYQYMDVEKGPWVQVVIGYTPGTVTGVVAQNSGANYRYTGQIISIPGGNTLYELEAYDYDQSNPPQYLTLGTVESPEAVGSGAWMFTTDTDEYVDTVASTITTGGGEPIWDYAFAQAVVTQNGYYYYWTGEVVSGVYTRDLNVLQAFNYDPENPPQYLRLGTTSITENAYMRSLEDGSGPKDMTSKLWIEGAFIQKNDTVPAKVYNSNYGSFTFDSDYIYDSQNRAVGFISEEYPVPVSDMDFTKGSVVEGKQTWTGTIPDTSAFGTITLYTADDMPAQGSNAYEDPAMTIGQTIKSTVVVDIPPTPIAVNCVVSYSVDGTTWTEHSTALTDDNNVICNIPRYLYLKFSQDVEITEP